DAAPVLPSFPTRRSSDLHMLYGKPVVGVDIAACSLRFHDAQGRLIERFPRAGGYSTVCIPPPIATLAELAEWFRVKPGGTNSAQGFIQTLGEEEGILYADVDLEAVRRFPGYFYRAVRVGGDGTVADSRAGGA